MKKFLAILMMLLLVVQAISVMGISAQDGTDYSANLVTHWDFDGETPYADKATAGSSSDTLSLSTTDSATASGGVVRVSSDAGKYIYANGADGTDLYSLAGKTIVMRFALDTRTLTGDLINSTKSITLFYKKNAAQYQFSNNAKKWNEDYAYDIDLRTWSGTTRITKVAGPDVGDWYGDNGFHYMVVSYDYNSSTNTLVEKYYYSQSAAPAAATDFVKVYEASVSAASGLASGEQLWLGKAVLDETTSLEAIYDDVKIYNTVMTIEDVTQTLGGDSVVSTLPAYSTTAVPQINENISDHLVSHWDFEGTLPWADKATNGATLDPMSYKGTVSVENGVAKVSNLSGSYLEAPGKNENGDLYSMKNKTIVVKVKVVDADIGASQSCTLMYKAGSFQVSLEMHDETDMQSPFDSHFRTYDGGTAADYRITNVGGVDTGNWTGADGQFHYLVLSYAYNGVTGELTQNCWFSETEYPESAEDFVLLYTDTMETSASVLTWGSSILFGKQKATDSNRRAGYEFDDIKVYDRPLTLEQAFSTLDIDYSQKTAQTTPKNTTANKDNGANNTTKAPDATTAGDNADAQQTEETTAVDEKKGCGAAISLPMLIVSVMTVSAVGATKRRKSNQ